MVIENKSRNIPPHMNIALISVLLKPNKDPALTLSYRLISLINSNLKIISKAQTNRLESVISYLIQTDQIGFINGSHSSTNMCCLFGSMNISQRNTIITSVEAEKAFDKGNWTYFFLTLKRFSL